MPEKTEMTIIIHVSLSSINKLWEVVTKHRNDHIFDIDILTLSPEIFNHNINLAKVLIDKSEE